MQSFIVRWYGGPALSKARTRQLVEKLQRIHPHVHNLETEWCYHVEVRRNGEDENGQDLAELSEEERRVLEWLLRAGEQSALRAGDGETLIECGPRFNFSSPQSTNAVSVCRSAGIGDVVRLERSTRYLIKCGVNCVPNAVVRGKLLAALHDRMTECEYTTENMPRRTFDEGLPKGGLHAAVRHVDVLGEGSAALEQLDAELGLGFDAADLEYYTRLFRDLVRRNPTDVECFDLAQSNSEHSRHWFFKGRLVVDGHELPHSLIDMIVDTQLHSNDNNVIKFSDNSSSVRGWRGADVLRPTRPGLPSELAPRRDDLDIIFTAETHNFPTGVAPFPGATTGTGGRLRDVQAVGRGGEPIAGTAGYCTADLRVPGYVQPWERDWGQLGAASRFAAPLDVMLRASDGASDYGNKFGEPVVCGFARTYSGTPGKTPLRAWLKPVMFSGGLGVMDARHANKRAPKPGMLVCKIGGPAYRIGVGGGAASSAAVQGGGDSHAEHLDWNAVQRGDAEMGQKLNRAVRGCVEMGADNPIASIHDQGAGGNGNVLKELLEPLGGIIRASSFELGDPTLTPLELWAAEYQESNALLCDSGEPLDALRRVCLRERCPLNVVGEVGDDGRVRFVVDGLAEPPYDLQLEHVLGEGAAPRKTFHLERSTGDAAVIPPSLPSVTVRDALELVLRLPAVASKRYLCNKVDRCVTGLIAQQQCVGPLHVPVADCAVVAVAHFEHRGAATSLGEQPLKLLVDAAAGARMTVAEALQNLVFCPVSTRRDIKCSGNWMWAARADGEGARLADACAAMCAVMAELGVAVDGGKDSLGMAARTDGGELVIAPPQLVVSCYAPCPDVRAHVTPAVRSPALGRRGALLHVDCGVGRARLGGSAFAQCYGVVGLPCPDLDEPGVFAAAWDVTQRLVSEGRALSGHDVSDGGLVTCLLEMAFAGACGLDVRVTGAQDVIGSLFAEEAGWVLEVADNEEEVARTLREFEDMGVKVRLVGHAVGYGLKDARVVVRVVKEGYDDEEVAPCVDAPLVELMLAWEETSYRLELLQADENCARAEWESWRERTEPRYGLSFDPTAMLVGSPRAPLEERSPLVCVLREEGSNGDRELAAAFSRAGFRVWDATMADLAGGHVSTASFRGLAFPGGFSYADVLGSARGWAAACTFNDTARRQLEHFLHRRDTFSFGVCNGCQLLALLPGWLTEECDEGRVSLERNTSERFECRWGAVRIEPGSRALMFGGADEINDWPGRTDMRGSTLGVWSAHGEGRFEYVGGATTLGELERTGCVALRYADDNGSPTERYPYNPNGSVGGVAALCSRDGRHLAMMPHPERADQMYQWPWTPPHWPEYQHSPWHAMFLNAYHWCVQTTSTQ